jgi:hypothetical protein
VEEFLHLATLIADLLAAAEYSSHIQRRFSVHLDNPLLMTSMVDFAPLRR